MGSRDMNFIMFFYSKYNFEKNACKVYYLNTN